MRLLLKYADEEIITRNLRHMREILNETKESLIQFLFFVKRVTFASMKLNFYTLYYLFRK